MPTGTSAVDLVAELHRRQREMYAGGSVESVVELLAEDIAWHVPGRSPIAGDHRGVGQVIAYFEKRRLLANATMRMQPGEVIAEGGGVAQFVEGSAVLDGQPVSWRTIGVYSIDIEHRLVREVWLVPLDGELFDRIWSPAPTVPRLPVSETAYLRPLESRDAEELHAVIEANRTRLARWLSWASAQTLEDTRGFIREAEGQLARNDGFQAAILCEGEIAGVIGYAGVDWRRRSTTLGYWLGEKHQGKGTMTAAVRALVDQALLAWKLNRVEIRAATENRDSRAIPERLGFRQEGTLRQAELVSGRYLDSAVYSMLAAEWHARRVEVGPQPGS